MTEYTTMRVPKADWEQAKESKRESETWGEFLQRCSENPPEIREFVESENTDEIAEALKQEIDSLAFNGAVFEDEAERIIEKIEQLNQTVTLEATDKTEIAKEVARELQS